MTRLKVCQRNKPDSLSDINAHWFQVFVHVSTAYCQCNEDVLEERGYQAPHSPLGIAKMTQLLDDEILNMITPKLLKGLPNTYAYTKALTEDLVSSYDNRIPIVITRPSIGKRRREKFVFFFRDLQPKFFFFI